MVGEQTQMVFEIIQTRIRELEKNGQNKDSEELKQELMSYLTIHNDASIKTIRLILNRYPVKK